MFVDVDWMLFLLGSVAITLAPGPDNLLVLSLGITAGRRPALATAWGMACGNWVHTAAVALGLASLLAASPTILRFIQLGGAAYLGWLAWRSWQAPPPTEQVCDPSSRGLGQWFRRGLTMNLLNPKVLLFFLAYLPPFIPENSPSPARLTIALGTVFVLQVMVLFSTIALGAGAIGMWWRRHPAMMRTAPQSTAAVLATLALILLVSALP